MIEWLRPHYAGEDGTLFLNVQAFVLESQGKKFVVDTCIGNDKRRSTPSYNMLALPFLEQLNEAGHPVESIDYVLCTHLHIEHIGWNTRCDGKDWIPTFLNARYLFSRIDWEDFSHMVDRPEFADSLLPIAEAGLHRLVDANHIITEEILLFLTPGHTPSHASVAIRSQGKEAVIRDLAHSPIQFADPEICTNFDFDRKMALETRKKRLKKACIRIVLLNITYADRRFDVRDERSIHGCSAHYGGSWLLSRQGNLLGNPR
jgi:glyoxylase-like metal-dependent hydrolase (beta-lactamase superfamily II)